MRRIKVVIIKHNKKQNIGKGFSTTEVEKAGVNKQQAKQIGLPVDVKRKSAHDENVATIKAHAEKAKAESSRGSQSEISRTRDTREAKEKS